MHKNSAPLSVTALNNKSKKLLEQHFPLIWVEGEISNFIKAASGHWYFSLKDKKSQIRCACFKNSNYHLKFLPENGMQVILQAKITLYEPRGEYQLIASHIELAGDGQLLKEYELLKNKLEKVGLFDQDNKKSLPEYPNKVGVISSIDGAAVHDILHVLKRRAPSLEVIIYPSQVQGESAALQLQQAIFLAEEHNQCDVLIIGRGGGSLEDLYAFNDEDLAYEIYNCQIPIISAVGHEIDFTISDFVADVRAATPSAAAEILSPDETQWMQWLDFIQENLIKQINNRIEEKQNQLNWKSSQLQHPDIKLQQYQKKFDEYNYHLSHRVLQYLNYHQHQLDLLSGKLRLYQPLNKIITYQEKCQVLTNRLQQAIFACLQNYKNKLEVSAQKLDALSPLSIMSRGYALAYKKDKNKEVLIKSKEDVKDGELLKIQFSNSYLTARAIKTTNN